MRAHISIKSGNSKTGPIPVTMTEKASCPPTCPLKGKGCYAEMGYINIHWNRISQPGTPYGTTWDGLCEAISNLPSGIIWRHNQAGDLPGDGTTIDQLKMKKLVIANMGKMGFTYTHYPLENTNEANANKEIVQLANANGFTVNLSANNLAHADSLMALGAGPVVVVLQDTQTGRNGAVETPDGHSVVVCPATYKPDVTCQSCKLCARVNRNVIVGFPAHGRGKHMANKIAKG